MHLKMFIDALFMKAKSERGLIQASLTHPYYGTLYIKKIRDETDLSAFNGKIPMAYLLV